MRTACAASERVRVSDILRVVLSEDVLRRM
jgi:hypothetical protein